MKPVTIRITIDQAVKALSFPENKEDIAPEFLSNRLSSFKAAIPNIPKMRGTYQ